MRAEWRGRPPRLWALMGLLGVLGVRGLLGGTALVLAPSGDIVGASTSVLSGTALRDFLLPGLVLFAVFGVAPLAVLYGLVRNERWAWSGSLAVAVAFAVWAVGEGFVLGFGERLGYLNLLQAVAMMFLTVSPPVRGHFREAR